MKTPKAVTQEHLDYLNYFSKKGLFNMNEVALCFKIKFGISTHSIFRILKYYIKKGTPGIQFGKAYH